MSEIPKLVTDRLRKNVVTTHPDADLLAAFAEKSLSDREQVPVLAHLATCADCREVVALATLAEPELVSSKPAHAVARLSTSSWFRWPMLRWGAAAACVVIIGAAVLYNTGSMQKKAMKGAVSDAEPELQATQSVPPPTESASDSAKEQLDQKTSGDRRQKVEARLVPPPATADSISAGKPGRSADRGIVAGFSQKGEEVANSAVPAESANKPAGRDELSKAKRLDAPSLRERVEEANAAGGPKKGEMSAQEKTLPMTVAPGSFKAENEKDRSGVRLADKNAPHANPVPATAAVPPPLQAAKAAPESRAEKQDQKAAAIGQASETVEVTSEAVAVPTAEFKVSGSAGSLTRGFATANWNVNAAGAVLRSLDGGKHWQSLSVDPRVKFTAIASIGSSVWVGGNSGALYHSPDGGNTWVRVTPTDGSATLASDVKRIQFDDVVRGSVFAGEERWSTTDGGKSWSRAQ